MTWGLIALHGRGGSPDDALALAGAVADGIAGVLVRAPAAPGGSWYPGSFMAGDGVNQPWLDQSRAIVAEAHAELLAAGVPANRIALLGFSQGGCLALDHAARAGSGVAAVLAYSAGRIGAPDSSWDATGLAGTPVLLRCAEQDAHIPAARFLETLQELEAAGALVDSRTFPGSMHGIDREGLAAGRALLRAVFA